jgi:hypothetical protein
MSARVNLLLLLSALLSALTGVGASARQPQLAQAVAGQTRTAPALVVQPVRSVRPASIAPVLAIVAAAPAMRVLALIPLSFGFVAPRRE